MQYPALPIGGALCGTRRTHTALPLALGRVVVNKRVGRVPRIDLRYTKEKRNVQVCASPSPSLEWLFHSSLMSLGTAQGLETWFRPGGSEIVLHEKGTGIWEMATRKGKKRVSREIEWEKREITQASEGAQAVRRWGGH